MAPRVEAHLEQPDEEPRERDVAEKDAGHVVQAVGQAGLAQVAHQRPNHDDLSP